MNLLPPFRAVVCLGAAILGLFSLASADAAGLAVDAAFKAPFFARSVPPQRALLLPDGKYLLFLDPDTLTDQPTGPITRYFSDGTFDSSFNFSRVYKQVSAPAPAGNGKLYVAASRYSYGIKEAEEVLRLNADGSIDSSFTPPAVGQTLTLQDIQQLVVQPDGKVLVVGIFQRFGGNEARRGIARLMTDGSVDATFLPVTVDGFLYSVALQTDGKILIGGQMTAVNSVANPGLARLNADGSLDGSFQATGFFRNFPTSRVRGIVVQPDGLIVISGAFRTGTGAGAQRMPLLRLTATGAVDSTFNAAAIVPAGTTGRELVLLPDGKIVAAIGSSVYRVNINGSNDTSFQPAHTINATFDPPVAGTPVTVHLQSDGRILVGGIFTEVNPPGAPEFLRYGVARLNSDGTLDSTLVTKHRTGVETAPTGFARLTDGSTLVTFSETIHPPIPYNVGRLLSDGSLDPNFTLSSSDPSRFLANGFTARGLHRLPDGNFFVHGVTVDGAPAFGKVQPNGAEDTSFATNPPYLPFQRATVAPDGKIVVEAGNDPQTIVYKTLGRLAADGQIESFAVPSSIYDLQVIRVYNGSYHQIARINVGSRVLVVQPDGKVLYEYFEGESTGRYHLIRLNADGSIDGTFAETTFTPTNISQNFPIIFDPVQGFTYQLPDGVWSATYSLLDAHVQADGRILVAGHFTSFANTNARGIVRLESNGTIDNTFNAGAGPQWTTATETATFYPTVEKIEAQADGKYLITGNFEAFNGVAAPGIARLNNDGSVDTSFVAPVQRDKHSRVASAFKGQPDGSYLLSGHYTFAGETTSRSLIRLVPAQPGAVNISTRLGVGTGENVLIEGFIVLGPTGSSKKIMVRAIGPSLQQFGIADALANPTLEIRDGTGALVATNNDWKTTQVFGLVTGDQFAEINTSGLAPANDLESALIVSLEPGSYTAVVRGVNNTVGTGIVDAFDLDQGSTARLANIATRGLVQSGDKLMIAGFIVQNGAVQVVVRAIGPSLVQFGISNALPDTTLQLRDQQGAIVLENDNWKSHQQQELQATGLQPSHDLEAALVATIQPGQYTAQVRGKDQASGIGVVEVYFPQ